MTENTNRRSRRRIDKVTRKYSAGYLAILILSAVISVVSYWGLSHVSTSYDTEISDILLLNNLYVETENIYSLASSELLYSGDNLEGLNGMTSGLRSRLDQIQENLANHYNRALSDYCAVLDTFLDAAEDVGAYVRKNRNELSESDYYRTYSSQAYTDLLGNLDEKNGFVLNDFKNAYADCMEQTGLRQNRIIAFRRSVQMVQWLLLAWALFLCAVYFHRVIHGISRSIRRLSDYALSMTENPQTAQRVKLHTGDEFELFAETFDRMVDRTQEQYARLQEDARIKERLSSVELENLRIVCLQQSTELRLLQSQINYHFLFNTLNTISQMSILENAPTTSDLISKTSRMLRYNLQNLSNPVTVSDELENLKNYTAIQEVRFGSRLRISAEVSEECLSQKIPCMILQPIIENSIKHGIAPRIGGGTVCVRIYRQGSRFSVDIHDDGIGIPQERAEQILSDCAEGKDSSGSIGMKNVYKRLKLFYGGSADFQIHSEPGNTTIHYSLPFTEEQES